jgi:hypothetical protein
MSSRGKAATSLTPFYPKMKKVAMPISEKAIVRIILA